MKRNINYFLQVVLLLMSFAAFAATPLLPEKAFIFSHSQNNNQVTLEWKLAPGYFLYKDKIKITSPTQLGKIELPAAEIKTDKIHGDIQVYKDSLKIIVPVAGQRVVQVNVGYQGCSEEGFCYPPVKKNLQIELKNSVSATSDSDEFTGEKYKKELLDGSNYFWTIVGFLGLGLLLAFTPCVLPMVPILSSIIIGHKTKMTTLKAFSLSFSYVLGMALMYAVAGIIIASIGSSIQIFFQKPWVIVLFSALFFLLALALLDVYKMHLPPHWQRRIHHFSNRQKSGTYLGAFVMGVLSTLIVSPCVSAPLVGVLAYIGQTGDKVLGGIALLAMGFGMGVPLLLLGMSAGKWLPKSGPWMQLTQVFIGLLMLGMAIWMLSRIVPASVTLFLSGALLLYAAKWTGIFNLKKKKYIQFRRGLGIIFLVYGMVLIVGAVMGGTDVFQPWQNWRMFSDHSKKINYLTLINSEKQLEDEILFAKNNHKKILVDFYADWCTSCVVLDRVVFNTNEVREALKDFILLRVDITEHDEFDQAIMKKFNVIAPPTVLFFENGEEIKNQRIVGEISQEEFLDHIQKLAGS